MTRSSIFTTANNFIWLIFVLMLIPTILVTLTDYTYLMEWTLVALSPTPLSFTLIADKAGLLFSCVVLFISANVLSFSKIYMSEDKFKNRFTVLVLLFIMSMNMLIFMPHFMMLLLGWDGLGITSFILVMYYQNPNSLSAAMITALTNRIGDVAILLAIAMTLNQGHWLITNMHQTPWLQTQILLITLAAMTKSAQMPFSSWLPAAMAAPTPVSALVHSSTLVTAGVFLLIRFYPFLHQIPQFNQFMLFIATSTTLMAGLSATTECDFKKIVALSTLSQLGIMMFSIGLDMPWLAFFHMTTHALFKALLFICVGSFINYHSHSQDLRWMGNIVSQMPIIVSCLTISNLALCGFPFLAGFYSKDMIMEYMLHSTMSEFLIEISMFSLGLTSFYTTRAMMVGVLAPKTTLPFMTISEPKNITTPAILLALAATVMGASMSWMYPIYSNITHICTLGKNIPLIYMIIGLMTGIIYSTMKPTIKSYLMSKPTAHTASCTMWFLTPMSTQFMLKSPLIAAHKTLTAMDQGWAETVGSQGLLDKLINRADAVYAMTPSKPNASIMSSSMSIALLMIVSSV